MKDLVRYLEKNCNYIEERDEQRLLIDDVIERFQVWGINPEAKVYREVALSMLAKNKIGITDAIVFDESKGLYFIEAKIILSRKVSRRKMAEIKEDMRWQLKKDYEFFKKNFGQEGMRIGVYRNIRGRGFRTYLPMPSLNGELCIT